MQVASKLAPEDHERVERAVDEAVQWMDANQVAEVDELEARLKELEITCTPVMTKLYQGTGGPPRGAP